AEVPPAEWRAAVALVPQTPVMLPGTVAENLRAPWALALRRGTPAPDDRVLAVALASVGLGEVALDRDAAKLSVGQAARVAMLRTVLTDPRVLLLDEPDANLDDASAAQVAFMTRTFASRGGAVVRVRHVERGERGARRYRLEGGRLAEESCA
ncbi:MAG: ATP-binding cassette domain-containing protein, partial [Actinobacteria bacterium]